MNKFRTLFGTMFLTIVMSCGLAAPAAAGWFDPPTPTSDAQMEEQMENLLQQSQRVVGMPSIVNFFERQMVRMLYEIRDDPEFRTFTYVMTLNGDFIKICDSIGYGINSSIQFSNSEKVVSAGNYRENGLMTMPQMEPNGLSMPAGLAATYILCVNPDPNIEAIGAIYLEPDAIVSPWPLGDN